jgi:transposase
LIEVVLQPASRFGYETDFWTSRRVQQVCVKELGVTVSRPTVWRMLRDADLTYQKPERKYFEANEAEREEWIRTAVPQIRAVARKYKAILYCEDEANISLSSVLARTWSIRGVTPKQAVTGKRGAVSAMSAVAGAGQLVFTLHDQRIASDEVIEFLKQLLRHHRRRHLVVVMDQAPPHVSKKTRNFIASQRRLHVFHLPPYSPDFNPDEKVWNHLKHQELKSHQARTKTEIRELAQRKLDEMSHNRRLVQGIFFRCCIADLLK